MGSDLLSLRRAEVVAAKRFGATERSDKNDNDAGPESPDPSEKKIGSVVGLLLYNSDFDE